MKLLFLVFMFFAAGSLFATQDDLTPIQVLASQKIIKASGYTCDTVDGQPFFSDSYTIEISCNNKYRYLLKDIGGNWKVTVK